MADNILKLVKEEKLSAKNLVANKTIFKMKVKTSTKQNKT